MQVETADSKTDQNDLRPSSTPTAQPSSQAGAHIGSSGSPFDARSFSRKVMARITLRAEKELASDASSLQLALPAHGSTMTVYSPLANNVAGAASGTLLGGFQAAQLQGAPLLVAPLQLSHLGAASAAKLPLADRVGIWLSFICVIHCLATPILLLVFPALEAMKVTQLHESFHLALLLILPIVAVIAFIPGYRKHGNRAVFYWALPGLLIIAYVALFFEEAGWLATGVSVTGSLLLIRAHSINRRLCACCHV